MLRQVRTDNTTMVCVFVDEVTNFSYDLPECDVVADQDVASDAHVVVVDDGNGAKVDEGDLAIPKGSPGGNRSPNRPGLSVMTVTTAGERLREQSGPVRIEPVSKDGASSAAAPAIARVQENPVNLQPLSGGRLQQPFSGGRLQQPFSGGRLQQPFSGGLQQPVSGGGLQQPMSGGGAQNRAAIPARRAARRRFSSPSLSAALAEADVPAHARPYGNVGFGVEPVDAQALARPVRQVLVNNALLNTIDRY